MELHESDLVESKLLQIEKESIVALELRLKLSIQESIANRDKWIQYEKEYILPCFDWAKEIGFDLYKGVVDNKGMNCVHILVRELINQANIITLLSKLSSADRLDMLNDIVSKFCIHCGTVQPSTGLKCQCWNDD